MNYLIHQRTAFKQCFKCGDYADNPWNYTGQDCLVCDDCHPRCLEDGCNEFMQLGCEGGCAKHAHLFPVEPAYEVA